MNESHAEGGLKDLVALSPPKTENKPENKEHDNNCINCSEGPRVRCANKSVALRPSNISLSLCRKQSKPDGEKKEEPSGPPDSLFPLSSCQLALMRAYSTK